MKYKVLLMNIAVFYAFANSAGVSNPNESCEQENMDESSQNCSYSQKDFLKLLAYAAGGCAIVGGGYYYHNEIVDFFKNLFHSKKKDEPKKDEPQLTPEQIKAAEEKQKAAAEKKALENKFEDEWSAKWGWVQWFHGSKDKYFEKRAKQEAEKVTAAVKEKQQEAPKQEAPKQEAPITTATNATAATVATTTQEVAK